MAKNVLNKSSDQKDDDEIRVLEPSDNFNAVFENVEMEDDVNGTVFKAQLPPLNFLLI